MARSCWHQATTRLALLSATARSAAGAPLRFLAGTSLLVALFALSGPAMGVYEIPQSVIAGGGGSSAGGSYALTGTIGQSLVSTSSGGSYVLKSGFWGGGNLVGPLLTLDIDMNGNADALTDGLLILRSLFGLTGTSLTTNAIGPNATLTTPQQIAQRLADVNSILDIDANNQFDALTDGLMIIRYLFGLRGNSLIAGAIGPNATRTQAAAIEAYIQSLIPP
ncbi:MAG: hypothetical protein ABI831_15910 [Betaproteobacteria bacterium]